MNIRHELDPIRVAEAVARRIAWDEERKAYAVARAADSLARYQAAAEDDKHLWRRKPDPAQEAAFFDACIENEKAFYAKVRVIELPQPGKRFILVYGDTDDETCTSGTGPFESIEAAGDWFFNLGR